MKELGLDEIKRYTLEILLEFDRICRENNIRYSLGGGTLLGAVRHKGFIPWDDDIDIMMLADEYRKFEEICKKSSELKIISFLNNDSFYDLFGKAYNEKTYTVSKNRNVRNHNTGLCIDIFPFFYLDNDYECAVSKMKNILKYKNIFSYRNLKYINYKEKKDIVKLPGKIYKFIKSRCYSRKFLLNKIMSFVFEKPAFYVTNLHGNYKLKEILKASFFDEFCELEFEGHKLMAIKEYDEYLKDHYGNYMELPPENKRITHHHFKAYIKE